jgi:ribonucleoside-diphosphate reductase alpha chain
MLAKVDALLAEAAGRRLRPIEVYDLCMLITRAVRRDGARRSASLCLFSPEDEEMVQAKTGDWLRQHPQRAGSNNSAVVLRPTADEARFRHLLAACRSHGEPGIFFSDHADHGCNPCGETGLQPVLTGPFAPETAARLRAAGYTGPLAPATRLSGWQMCNLTTINGAALATADRLFTAAIHAAVIGTLQAAYTDIDYLGPVTRVLNERDALLGVSICGFLDQPGLLLAPRLLERAARLCRAANEAMARALGIRPAARVTCVKPEGTASLLLGTAAGIHPHHARRYFRRILADRNDPVYQRFQARNPEMTEPSAMQPGTDDCITFPVEAPPHASVRDDFSAVEFLDLVRLVRRHWVLAGEAPHPPSPGLHHNVSHTCTVRAEEWDDVADYLWRHRDEFSGVALLPAEAARHYPQPPLQAATENDAAFWNSLRCRPVDYQGVGAPWSAGNRDADEPCAAGRCDAP